MIQRGSLRALAGLVALAAAAGCSESTRAVVPESIAVTAGNGQTGQVGTSFPAPLQVTVTGSDQRPFGGATVRWRVTSGSATVQPDSSVTDVNGVALAAVSLGGAAGPVTVTGTVEGVAPATFSLGSTAAAAAVVTATSGSSGQSGVVGAALANRVGVRVQDRFGNVVPGAEVIFAAGNGGSMEPARGTTDAQGVAQTTWTLGRLPGSQSATASVAGLPTVGFTATAAPGAPATLTKVGGDGQRGRPGSALPVPFEVRVADQFQNLVPGATVTWAVTGGGGTLSATTSQTGPNGVAGTRLTLGAAEGPNTVTATVGNIQLTFTATSILNDPCSAAATLTTGTSVTGELSASDCPLPAGEYADYYVFQPAAQQAVSVRMSSGAFDAFLDLTDNGAPRRPIASDNNGAGGTDALIRAILPAGTWVFGASSASPRATGAYTLAPSALAAGSVLAQCAVVWTARGVSVTEALASNDCSRSGGAYYSDQVRLYLRAGESVTLDQTSSFDTYMLLYGPSGAVVAADDDSGDGLNSRIVYTATTTGVYVVEASSYGSRVTGAYTLTIQ